MVNSYSKKILWWLCLFLAPLTLLSIELFHPAGFTAKPGMFAYLSSPQPFSPQHHALEYFGPQWWFLLHMIQTPLVGLVAGGLWLMGSDPETSPSPLTTFLTWGARLALFVFFVYYTVLDAIGGIGLGQTLRIINDLMHAGELTAAQVSGLELVLNTLWNDCWVGGVGSFVSQTASWAIFLATLFTAGLLLVRKSAPWPACFLLIAFGWELQLSHASYHGPLAFGLLIISAFWMWRAKPQK